MPRFDHLFAATAQIDGQGRSWVQVMQTGDRLRNGRYHFTITLPDLATYAQSIESNAGRIQMDYDHPDPSNARDTRAAGWFTGQTKVLAAGDVRPDGSGQPADDPELWSEVQWTPRAQQEIRDGEYRFVSPEFSFQERDAKTGLMTKAKAFLCATLTNRPFFRMQPVTAADLDDGFLQALADRFGVAVEDLTAIAADPSKPYGDVEYADPGVLEDGKKRYPLDTEDHIRAAWSYINQEKNAGQYTADQLASIKSKIGAAMKRIGANVTATEGEDMPDMKAVATALGLPEDATEDQIVAAAKAKTDSPGDDKNVVKLTNAQHAELEAKAALGVKASQDLAEMKVTTMFDDAERDNRMAPAERDTLTALCKSGDSFDDDRIAGVKAALDARPKGSFKEQGTGGDGKPGTATAATAEAADEFASAHADDVDDDSVKVHVRAEEILKEDGVKASDPDYATAYVRAANKATRELAAA